METFSGVIKKSVVDGVRWPMSGDFLWTTSKSAPVFFTPMRRV